MKPTQEQTPQTAIPPPLTKEASQPQDWKRDFKPPAKAAPCPWTLRVEIVEGRTHLTAQTGKEVQFRVTCDKLELKHPGGIIDASGSVKVTSEGLAGNCQRLTIAWQEDHVVLEGDAELKCNRDGQEVELKAARLSLRLSGQRVIAQASATSEALPSGTTATMPPRIIEGDVESAEPPLPSYPNPPVTDRTKKPKISD